MGLYFGPCLAKEGRIFTIEIVNFDYKVSADDNVTEDTVKIR